MRAGKQFCSSLPGLFLCFVVGFAVMLSAQRSSPPSTPGGATSTPSGLPSGPGGRNDIPDYPATRPPDSVSRSKNVPVIKSNTRLVLLDVVVRGKNDQPITGLKGSDFTVIEEGRPQQIKFFEEHSTPQAVKAAPARVLPPHDYTNVPEQDPSAPLMVILLDTLNTPMLDQVYGREQLLKFLKTMPRGQRAALFTLGSRLHVVQGFTGRTDELVVAATRLSAKSSPLLTSESESQKTEDSTTRMEAEMGPYAAAMADALRQALADQEAMRIDQRVGITLQALSQLARSMAGYSGRKNLLWLSGGFPFSLGADVNLNDPMRNMRNYAPAINETAGQLAGAQVAVYPIDIRGLVTTGIDITSSGQGAMGLRRGGSRYGALLTQQSQSLNDSHNTMKDIAEQTGGEAFYNTNGLATAMTKTVQQTATYYTLAYAPDNRDWDGKFRKINIKLDREARLDYRRGYFASTEQELTPKDSQRLLASAIQPGTPDSTSLLFLAEVLPPEANRKTVQVNFSLDPRRIAISDQPNGRKHAMIDLLGIAWDKNGRDGGHFSATLDVNMTPATFAKVMRGGLPARQEFDLKPGTYRLRLGVMDRSSHNIGTLEVPLTAP